MTDDARRRAEEIVVEWATHCKTGPVGPMTYVDTGQMHRTAAWNEAMDYVIKRLAPKVADAVAQAVKERDEEIEQLAADYQSLGQERHEEIARLTKELAEERKRTNYHWHTIAQYQGERAELLRVALQAIQRMTIRGYVAQEVHDFIDEALRAGGAGA